MPLQNLLWVFFYVGIIKVMVFFKDQDPEEDTCAYISSLPCLMIEDRCPFRKMVRITLYARQQKRHRCIEQVFWTLWDRERVG